MPRRKKRIDPAAFELPVDRIRSGVDGDRCFVRAREVLRADQRGVRALLQVSARTAGWIAGIDEAIAVLKLGVEDWSALTVQALFEGDRVEPWDTVMTIEGPYDVFAPLETLVLGTLARRSRIGTNTRLIVDAARPKPVVYDGARQDHWAAQPGDGYAATVGGALGVSTDAQAALSGGRGIGFVPHALIAAYDGDTVRAARAFAAHVPADVDVVVVVDYENDAVRTSLAVARALEGRLWGVRLDTAETMVDRSVIPQMGAFPPTGVNPQLVWNVRNALDGEGFGDVKIVVSGGLTAARVRAFEEEKAPVDLYAVGRAILNDGRFDFVADVVMVDGQPQARAGRELRPNARLERVR